MEKTVYVRFSAQDIRIRSQAQKMNRDDNVYIDTLILPSLHNEFIIAPSYWLPGITLNSMFFISEYY